MEITHLYQMRTESLTATEHEIATIIVNMAKGFRLTEVYAEHGKLTFVFENMVGEGK